MSVMTPLNSERKIGSFSGADHREAMNKSLVGLIMGSSLGMEGIIAEKGGKSFSRYSRQGSDYTGDRRPNFRDSNSYGT